MNMCNFTELNRQKIVPENRPSKPAEKLAKAAIAMAPRYLSAKYPSWYFLCSFYFSTFVT